MLFVHCRNERSTVESAASRERFGFRGIDSEGRREL
jgi:hypothetical protein